MIPAPPSDVRSYIKQVAATLRAREANMHRGKPAALEALDRKSDLELVTRWAWTAAIMGAVVCFAGGPLLLIIIHPFLPVLIYKLFWALVIVGMGCVALMFAAAAWLTFNPPGE